MQAFSDSGLYLVMAPEETGGLGGTVEEAAALVTRWSARAAPLPIVELIVAAAVAPEGIDSRCLAVCPECPGTEDAEIASDGLADATGWPDATHLLVVAGGSRRAAVLVGAKNAERWTDLCGMTRFRLPAAAWLAEEWKPLPDSAPPPGVVAPLLTVAAMTGVMEHIVSIAIDHAQTRKQFGRPVARFQAVQGLVSAAASELAVTRAVLNDTLKKADGGTVRDFDVAVAKAQAGRAATLVAAHAHQVFGAIGFSNEHELHHYTKRLWQWRDQWGHQSHMERQVGARACTAGMEGLWKLIVN